MCPHSAQRRRCSHHPFDAKHSTQPVPLGFAFGSKAPSLDDVIGLPVVDVPLVLTVFIRSGLTVLLLLSSHRFTGADRLFVLRGYVRRNIFRLVVRVREVVIIHFVRILPHRGKSIRPAPKQDEGSDLRKAAGNATESRLAMGSVPV